MWADESVFYHIYPLGFCGAPAWNDFSSRPSGRIYRLAEQIEHLKNMNVNAVYLGPVFESGFHGYDTADYFRLDARLGTNDDFAGVCRWFHDSGIRIVLDGVFNHVGRHFWAFRDVLERREASPYYNWFYIRRGRNNRFGDGFTYRTWEGHAGLVKLRLTNKDTKNHLFEAVRMWIERFGIDGLRLDAAHHLDKNFIRNLRYFCKSLKPDFWLMGEVTGGDYNDWMNDDMLDSVTNYEAYGCLFSAFNNRDMGIIARNIQGQHDWYRWRHLYNFADNHDVSRIASRLKRKRDLKALYTVLFSMPGIPSVYYASEFGVKGNKRYGDHVLRPETAFYKYTPLTRLIARLAGFRREYPVFSYGNYKELYVTNHILCFARELDGQVMICAVNAGEHGAAADYYGHSIPLLPKTIQILLNGHTLLSEKY